MKYRAKTLIDGYKVGREFIGKILVAVPKQKAGKGSLVQYQDQTMQIETEPLFELTFPDKFGRGSYVLCYFEWRPKQVQVSLW
jgi:hypothetical protein